LLNTSGETEACQFDDQQVASARRMKHQKNGSVLASKGDKFCSVCGDRALGCNFDAVSCESCKAFFRRNALKQKVYNHVACLDTVCASVIFPLVLFAFYAK